MDYKEIGRQIQSELMGAQYVEDKDKKKQRLQLGAARVFRRGVLRTRVVAHGHRPQAAQHPQRRHADGAQPSRQLRNHVEGALNNGCTVDELREILLHTAVYCGLPAAGDAFRVAEEVLKARKLVE